MKKKHAENLNNQISSTEKISALGKKEWLAPKLLELESDQTQTAKSMINMFSYDEILQYGSAS